MLLKPGGIGVFVDGAFAPHICDDSASPGAWTCSHFLPPCSPVLSSASPRKLSTSKACHVSCYQRWGETVAPSPRTLQQSQLDEENFREEGPKLERVWRNEIFLGGGKKGSQRCGKSRLGSMWECMCAVWLIPVCLRVWLRKIDISAVPYILLLLNRIASFHILLPRLLFLKILPYLENPSTSFLALIFVPWVERVQVRRSPHPPDWLPGCREMYW